ncbi:MAG: replication initiation protein [Galactobacter sp.]
MTDGLVAERWEQLWLPWRPLASDDLLAGVYRHARPTALGMRYVESNPAALSNLLVVDIDHDDAALRACWDRAAWWPNLVVENPVNGHAHAVWALREPVTRTEYAHRKPLALAAAVSEGLRRSVDGDQGYSGLLTKNPVHGSWNTVVCNAQRLYGLHELAGCLDEAGYLPPASWKRSKRRNMTGLGRNCSIFETARTWAYRAVRHHFGDSDGLHAAISAHVHELNAEFPEPEEPTTCEL